MPVSIKYLFILSLLLLQFNVKAQRITPIAVSNYGTAQSLFISPSLNGYSDYAWHVNLAGAWVNVNNNAVTLKLPFSAYRIPNRVPNQYLTGGGDLDWSNDWLKERLNGRGKKIDLAGDIYGPSASVKIKNFRVGLITQASTGARVHCLSESLSHAIVNEFDSAQGAFELFNNFASGKSNTFDKLTFAANTRIQVGGNVNYTIPLEWNRSLIVGATVKRAWGFNGQYLQSEKMTLRPVAEDSIVFSPTSIEHINFGDGERGKGWGYDLGLTYVFHKKDFKRPGGYAENQTRYHTKISVALMDIGSIKYKNADYTSVIIDREVGVNTRNLEGYANGSSNYIGVFDSFINAVGSISQYKDKVVIGLPTRFVFSVDKQIKKHLFVNATISQSLRKRHSKNARYQSALMLAPRLEYHYFEFSLPLLMEYDYRSFRLGASMRLGPLYLGTNSLASFLYTRSVNDADFFIGVAFGNLSNFGFRKLWDEKAARRKKRKEDCSKM